MKVYLVVLDVPYEGESIEAIYFNGKSAEQYAKLLKERNRSSYYKVNEMFTEDTPEEGEAK